MNTPNTVSGSGRPSGPAVVIIGAGFSGICMAIDLIRRNKTKDFIILEKSCQFGGTWNDNRYPGCSCDVQSHLYSYSFEPNDWTREFAGQPEIQSYLVRVAEKWRLFEKISFNSEVEEISWNEKYHKWNVKVSVTGDKERCHTEWIGSH